jgi:hypothetical protein
MKKLITLIFVIAGILFIGDYLIHYDYSKDTVQDVTNIAKDGISATVSTAKEICDSLSTKIPYTITRKDSTLTSK